MRIPSVGALAVITAMVVPGRLSSQELSGGWVRARSGLDEALGAGWVSPTGLLELYWVDGKGDWGEWWIRSLRTGQAHRLGDAGADVVWSPRGDEIAFARFDEQPDNLHIWTWPIDPETGRERGPPRRVSVRAGRSPAWSPDGRRIAFTGLPRSDSVRPRIIEIPSDGGEESILFMGAGWTRELSWSADGRWIYFLHVPPGTPQTSRLLRRVPAGGGRVEDIGHVLNFIGASPVGSYLAWNPGDVGLDHSVVAIGTPEGKELVRVRVPDQGRVDGWTNGALKLRARTFSDRSEIRLARGTGPGFRTLKSDRQNDVAVSWSPDSKRLALISLSDDRARLFIVDARTGAGTEVPTTDAPLALAPLWSPDARNIAFASVDGVLHIVSPINGRSVHFASGAVFATARWNSDGGSILYQKEVDEARDSLELHQVMLDGSDRLLRRIPRPPTTKAFAFATDTTAVYATTDAYHLVHLRRGEDHVLYTRRDDEQFDFLGAVPISTDSRFIAIPMKRSGSDVILILSVPDGRTRILPQSPSSRTARLVWHPDGRHLLTIGPRSPGTERMDVLLIPLTGDPWSAITAGEADGQILNYSMAPDGSEIAFVKTVGLKETAWELDLTRALESKVSR